MTHAPREIIMNSPSKIYRISDDRKGFVEGVRGTWFENIVFGHLFEESYDENLWFSSKHQAVEAMRKQIEAEWIDVKKRYDTTLREITALEERAR